MLSSGTRPSTVARVVVILVLAVSDHVCSGLSFGSGSHASTIHGSYGHGDIDHGRSGRSGGYPSYGGYSPSSGSADEIQKETKYYYGGKYQGSCVTDGLYYRDDTTFIICSNGYPHEQPCPPGTKTSGSPRYQPGYYYGYTDLCSVNLVDYGYGPEYYAPRGYPYINGLHRDSSGGGRSKGSRGYSGGRSTPLVRDRSYGADPSGHRSTGYAPGAASHSRVGFDHVSENHGDHGSGYRAASLYPSGKGEASSSSDHSSSSSKDSISSSVYQRDTPTGTSRQNYHDNSNPYIRDTGSKLSPNYYGSSGYGSGSAYKTRDASSQHSSSNSMYANRQAYH